MDFNIFLKRFGLSSQNFVNKPPEIIETEDGFIYQVEEEKRESLCPNCNSSKIVIHDRSWMTIKLGTTNELFENLRVHRIRYKCKECGKTFTIKLEGIERNSKISNFVLTAIKNEFLLPESFTDIANRFNLSVQTIINIFDSYYLHIKRFKMPEFLCIDEKYFETDDGKYCVVISDFFTGKVIDVIEDRRMDYLDDYFEDIPLKERQNVKVFISDMYDGYYTVKQKYFPNAIFVIDLFHVTKLLTTALNKIRIRTYNQIAIEETVERHFLKTNWKCFLIDQFKLGSKEYHSKKFDVSLPYEDIMLSCLKLNYSFWDGYSILQEMIHYTKWETYTESEKFMNRIIDKLNLSGDELLQNVAKSYKKWKVGIINGLARNQTGKRFSNAIAENNNAHIQKLINIAYGYKNFDRFRARILLILGYFRHK